eukprot:TRINITY_DN2407_c0_g1_i1.p1 TRINITY_DN2407_c0_g1~~TRINITY_DN2407_c0_g1_i1.p1  ORF type:complete len:693 (-),score=120.69 TRINITY_DN2407_c0_g1_i1:52-2130(-)
MSIMQRTHTLWVLVGVIVAALLAAGNAELIKGFRPPATPLVTMDPVMNVWLMADNLYDDYARYWDGTVKCLYGVIRVDGRAYRFMGPDDNFLTPTIQQTSVVVAPTQTYFTFAGANVQLNVTFSTALLPRNLDYMSRPITYISFDVRSTDGKNHDVQIYYDNTAEWAVNTVDEVVAWNRYSQNSLDIMRLGTVAQQIFGKSGDGVGIDWGYVYVSSPSQNGLTTSMNSAQNTRSQFVSSGSLPGDDMINMPRACSDNWPVLAAAWKFTATPSVTENYIMLSYDEVFSIQWFGNPLRPLWNKNNDGDQVGLLVKAQSDRKKVLDMCDAWDTQVIANMTALGGAQYATLSALAYRQTAAGTKLVWNDQLNTMWYFAKEISSDGDLSTVDVIFPASPWFLYYNPELLKLLVIPVLEYGNNATTVPYTFSWAPHHLGEYPIGYILPSQQENMPIEETGNMILMIMGVVQRQNNDVSWLAPYKRLLDTWGNYLIISLPDPGNQLCTDDFEGPTPHDTNLAAKGIVAMDAYASLLEIMGNKTGATTFRRITNAYVQYFQKQALVTTPSPHYKLQYDVTDSWSLKYNIVYQHFLNLTTFPGDVMANENNWYLRNYKSYGVPLDNRHDFTKLDWLSWVAAAASPSQFQMYMKALYNFANTSPDRVPLSDWYYASTGKVAGFRARPVVGGIWAKAVVASAK